jgi:hypothetical protein
MADVQPKSPCPTIEIAAGAYMADARDRGNSYATLYKKATVFERTLIADSKNRNGSKIPTNTTSLLRFSRDKGIRFLSELTLPTPRDWRATWKVSSLVQEIGDTDEGSSIDKTRATLFQAASPQRCQVHAELFRRRLALLPVASAKSIPLPTP